jgi:hypothetical protein
LPYGTGRDEEEIEMDKHIITTDCVVYSFDVVFDDDLNDDAAGRVP